MKFRFFASANEMMAKFIKICKSRRKDAKTLSINSEYKTIADRFYSIGDRFFD